MQQTNQYQFNLIESGDNFSAEPLNENAEKMEEALAGLHQTIADRIIFGSYTGNGASSRIITLGFTPKFVILFGGTLVGFFTNNHGYGIAQSSAGTVSCRVQSNGFTTTGFNTSGSTFTYFAFP